MASQQAPAGELGVTTLVLESCQFSRDAVLRAAYWFSRDLDIEFPPSTSLAFVDAAPYTKDSRCTGGSCDICSAVFYAFSDYTPGNSNGVVVDARGVNAGTSQYCSENPWSAFSTTPYSTVLLLPSGTINIQDSLVLPSNTRIVGQGPSQTILQACQTPTCSSTFSGTDMIDMGQENASICPLHGTGHYDCQGVIVEHLALNGNGLSGVNGIVNSSSQELSYVDDVAMTNMGSGGIGLYFDNADAGNSGPYTKIYYSGSGTCASILGVNIRGIHGLSCILSGSTAGSAVFIDGSNNSVEDVYVRAGTSQDGILLGSHEIAQNNVLFNISGSSLKNLVEIASGSSDLTVLGATQSGSSSTIRDNLTGTTVTDGNVGMYIVGESVQAGSTGVGYSRFTTSPNVVSSNPTAPNWIVGAAQPTTPCAIGSLYSRTSGTTGTLYGCQGLSSSPAWHKIE
jgi:hypothetical protein